MERIDKPKKRCDFKVGDMKFWLCEHENILLFYDELWDDHSISRIKIEKDGDVYAAWVQHNYDNEFYMSDTYDENREIYEKWQEILSIIEKELLGVICE